MLYIIPEKRWITNHQKLPSFLTRNQPVYSDLFSALPAQVQQRNRIQFRLKKFQDGKIIYNERNNRLIKLLIMILLKLLKQK